MINQQLVDHLFRHQYGKMVSILTHIFGLPNLELIEDAVQDTFSQALQKWRLEVPPNPEAWLTKAAKNRAIDLLRQVKSENERFSKIDNGVSAINLNDFFLDHEIEDSQLRMIFVACHPALNPKEQIAFALKTISGFNTREIATALLLKEETVKKRLSRTRKVIIENNIQFDLPQPKELPLRMGRVMEVIYLTFNEGFHSNNPKVLINKDLCGEAMRLCQLLLKRPELRTPELYALFALLCYHMARLESKTDEKNTIIDLKNQDRTKWYVPLITLGNEALNKASSASNYSSYHYEAAIAGEHLKASSFEDTNWKEILFYYEQLNAIHSTPSSLLNIAIVLLQLEKFNDAFSVLKDITPTELEQRTYLFFGCMAEYYRLTGNKKEAIQYLNESIKRVSNQQEKDYLLKKRDSI